MYFVIFKKQFLPLGIQCLLKETAGQLRFSQHNNPLPPPLYSLIDKNMNYLTGNYRGLLHNNPLPPLYSLIDKTYKQFNW